MHGTDIQKSGGEALARPSDSEDLSTTASTLCALPNQPDPVAFKQAMDQIRRRRKYFFATVIAYMPAMWLANKISPTFRSMAITFSIWVVVLFITALYSALARCPRCGHYFHMNGMSLLYLRRCLHCQNHINAS
ncbi:MAG: hypothetical protein OEL57_05510 [Trichlorobacter sp.]|uniref:hypothetical protein n=1 Tax=Trichlorobacter sp. TaxID=2911007 RepID=UPI00256C4C45|nr:hypothetical protein [Trichlorobacter sp.]MDK9717351.1 hypothetical protein [Trichlorobacter sp.]